ncbi:MAG: class D sortase [Anaerovoracaceae bacterium]
MKYKISFCLIIAGILLASVPFVGTLFQQYRQDQMYQSYLESRISFELTNKDAKEESIAMARNDDSESLAYAADGLSEDTTLSTEKREEKPTVLGRIFIEKINTDLMLVEGAGVNALNWGAGHIPGTGLPGEPGNCGIAAHRNYTFGSYFSRLDELIEGDGVKVDYLGKTTNYTVSEIKTVLPEDNTVLLAPEEENGEILTLVTCTPKGSNSHRLILHCFPAGVPDPEATPGEASQPL